MGTALIANPAGSSGLQASIGSLTVAAINGGSGVILPGAIVEIVTPFAGSSSPPYSSNGPPFQVKTAPTSGVIDGLVVGVAAGPIKAGQTSFAIGDALEVIVEGLALITCDDNGGGTTIGDAITWSTTTAGQGKDTGSATPVVGTALATALQTVTIASGSAPVWCYVHRV